MFLVEIGLCYHSEYKTNSFSFNDYLNLYISFYFLLMDNEALVQVQIEYVDENSFEIFRSEIENALGVGRFSFTGIIGKQFSVTVGGELICSSIPQDMARKEGVYPEEFGLILEKLKSLF